MWPFRERSQVRPVDERIERLEQDWKRMRLEWDEMFDRFRRLYAQSSKRLKRLEELESATIGDRDDTEGGVVIDRGGNGQPDPILGVLQRRRPLRGW